MKNLLPADFNFELSNLDNSNGDLDSDRYWLLPPLVDLSASLPSVHDVHGDLATELQAYQANGFLHLGLPPNTKSTLDTADEVRELLAKSAHIEPLIHLYPIANATAGLQGKKLANMQSLMQAGAVGVGNAAFDFANDDVLYQVMSYAASFGITLFVSATPASAKGVVHEGFVASYHGLEGMPTTSETVSVARLLLMAQQTKARLHIGQISCQASVAMIKHAKDKGVDVSCDVAMGHLFLTDRAVAGFCSNAYVLPPLRSDSDRVALIKGLQDGSIDAIVSQHLPRSFDDKNAPFDQCREGMSTIDAFMSLACLLVSEGVLSHAQLIAKICTNPAAILGIKHYNDIGGAFLVDSQQQWTLSTDTLKSQGKNTPLLGQSLRGRVVHVWF